MVPLLYEAMSSLARGQRAKWLGNHTMNTTDLVHEAYIKLAEAGPQGWDNRGHFLGVVAKTMRHVLIDRARSRMAVKRGGGATPIPLSDLLHLDEADFVVPEAAAERLLELDEALKLLAKENQREAEVVECRFFGAMTIEETAAALGVSGMTVKRDWSMARARLAQMLGD